MTEPRWESTGLMISAGAHVFLFAVALFAGDLFRAPDDDPIQVMETSFITEEEFAAISGEKPEEPQQRDVLATVEPEPKPEPKPEVVEPEPKPEVAEPLPEPAPEPEPKPEPKPEPEPKVAEAPYAVAPPAPKPLKLDKRATGDKTPDAEIREALPEPRLAEVEKPKEPVKADSTPEPPKEIKPDEAPKPDEAEKKVAEKKPEPKPEPKPTPEPEPEPEIVYTAPKVAALPRMRPRRQNENDKLLDDLLSTPVSQEQAQREQPRPAATPATPSRPLSAGEKSALAFNFKKHWTQPHPDSPDLAELVVKLEVILDREGRLVGAPKQLSPIGSLTPRQTTAIFNAMRAVRLGAPYQGPVEKYDRWRVIHVTYDPVRAETTIN